MRRVNFLKYKKPEKDLSNLDRSETFKYIHHIEREPRHGIQVRPAVSMAEEDVRNVSEARSTYFCEQIDVLIRNSNLLYPK